MTAPAGATDAGIKRVAKKIITNNIKRNQQILFNLTVILQYES